MNSLVPSGGPVFRSVTRRLGATAAALTTTAATVALTVIAVPAADAAPALPAPVACTGGPCWHPALVTSWNWVLSSVPSAPFRRVAMYDVDGFESTASSVASLHGAGIKTVCYISAGSYEKGRPDAAAFPASILGNALDGYPNERWLDVRDVQRSSGKLRAIMDARLDMCRQKGFDMVELDNVDGYLPDNDAGFPLTAADQAYYNAVLANDAHGRGMTVLQKNDNEQIPTLLRYFDGALNEQCNQYRECTRSQNGTYGLDQYIAAGKAVFQAEYKLATSAFCSKDNTADFNGVRYDVNLDDKVFQPCR